MLLDLVKGTFNTGLLKYGDEWRQHRRLMHQYFGAAAQSNYKPHVVRASRNLLANILKDPKNFNGHLRYMAGDAILAICYGLDVSTEGGSTYLPVVEQGIRSIIEAAVPGRFLVDSFPILKHVPHWLPGAGFQEKARVWKQQTYDMVNLPFNAAKKKFSAGTCSPCFTCSVAQSLEAEAGKEKSQTAVRDSDILRDAAATMYVAGSDTTVAALASCVLGLLGRPDVLRRAREDLDRVIKPGSLPELEDEPSLPFITAIAKEALRWREVAPIGLPHYIEVDDEYKGYRIPAGSIVIGNAWAMLHDEEAYPEPFLFKPERFMKGSEFNPDTKDPDHACWGFGRRICPGRFMAFPSIWISIASLIYAFDIAKEVDEKGIEIEPNPKYHSGIIVSPEPYPVQIKPRSKEFAQLIQDSAIHGV